MSGTNDSRIQQFAELLDLNALLISNPPATFFVQVARDSMIEAGIASGDLLVVDKGLLAKDGDIVIAMVGSEFTAKRRCQRNGQVALLPENPAYPATAFAEGQSLKVWGVIVGCVKRFLRKP